MLDPLRSGGNRSQTDPIFQLECYRLVHRRMFRGLVPQASRLLGLLLDESVMRGDGATKKFTYRFMEHGDDYSPGTGIGRSMLKVYVKLLEDLRMLIVDRSRTDGLVITINLAWTEEASPMLAQPKRLKGEKKPTSDDGWHEDFADPRSADRLTPGRSTDHPPVGTPTTITEEPSSVELSSGEPVSARLASRPADRVENSGLSISPRRRERPSSIPAPSPAASSTCPAVSAPTPVAPAPLPQIAPALTVVDDAFAPLKPIGNGSSARRVTKPTAGSLEKAFRAAFVEAHGAVAGAAFRPCSGLELVKLKQSLIAKWHGDTDDMHDFIEWYAREWPQIRKQTFGWMVKSPPPALPTLGFLVTQASRLMTAWNDRASHEWIATLDDRERQIYEELTRRQGLSHDAAQTKIAEDRAKRSLREEIDTKVALAAHHSKTAIEAANRMNRIKHYGPGNMHPGSPAAKRAKTEAVLAAARENTPAPGENLKPVANDEWDFGPYRED